MMIHLESGNCKSQVTIDDIDTWALEGHRSWTYVNQEGSTRYKCPTCGSPLDYISGLMQHLESNACHGSLERNLDSLSDHLERRIMNDIAVPHHSKRSAFIITVRV